jgi:predicted nucleic acid-binding protein
LWKRPSLGDLPHRCGRVSASGHAPEGVCSADATRRRARISARRAEFPRSGDASWDANGHCSNACASTNRLTVNDIPDAWIAAAVLAQHDDLASFDKGFRRFLKPKEFTLLQP